MPPRYSYWTILAGGLPTAFRAAERDDLLPTFHQLKRKHADAELRWFARGRLWASPEEATAAAKAPSRPPRGRDWRPGGSHQDPRQPFKDAKKARNSRTRQQRFERRARGPAGADRPEGTRHEGRHQTSRREGNTRFDGNRTESKRSDVSFSPNRPKRPVPRGSGADGSSRPPRRDRQDHRPEKRRR